MIFKEFKVKHPVSTFPHMRLGSWGFKYQLISCCEEGNRYSWRLFYSSHLIITNTYQEFERQLRARCVI